MPYIQLKEARYYYEDEGSGPLTLVFGHSLLFNLRMFDDQVSNFRDRYRCISIDFRGQGKSEVTKDGYDLNTLTKDVAELIERLGAGPCVFVGFSMGGMVAMRMASRQPDFVKALVLIDTSSEREPRMRMPSNLFMVWLARYFGLKLVLKRVMSMFFGKSFLSDPDRKDRRKAWEGHLLANDRVGVSRAVLGVLGREDITGELTGISVPTLILVGEEDDLTDFSKAQAMHDAIADSELKIIERASHMGPVEEPAQVNEYMEDFLNRIEQ